MKRETSRAAQPERNCTHLPYQPETALFGGWGVKL